MFYDLEEFTDRFVSTPGNIGLITYENKAARESFLNRFEVLLSGIEDDEKRAFVRIDASIFSAEEFHKEIMSISDAENHKRTILVVTNVDPLLPTGGRILNGCRERLTRFMVIIVLRENSLRNFQISAPDLMGLIGSYFASAEQMAEPIYEDDIL